MAEPESPPPQKEAKAPLGLKKTGGGGQGLEKITANRWVTFKGLALTPHDGSL